jgi:alkanesulfonate monooxygenase SsuD/methylene tetrahydromethanopterin reductase-like flavin-dependent oxidoreductase (luciferase family)
MSSIKIGIGLGTARSGVASAAQLCDYAERAEGLGIDSVWLSDRITGTQLDITAVMALIAARTKKIKMGPAVLTLPAHHPVHVARAYATLDHLSGGCGRVIMAVGLGNDPRQCEVVGIPAAERGGRMEEGVAVLRKLWAERNVTHQGKYYRFENLTIEPRPARGPLDVWIGGRTDVALKRVARYGDGWFPSFVTAEEYTDGMQRLIGYGAERGRADAILQAAAAVSKLPPESMAARSAVGPAGECAERLARFVAAGCTKFVLFPICPPSELVPQIEAYARDIIPRFA